MSKNYKSLKSLDARTYYHRAGRWLTEPKPEHKIVLQAVEIANKAFGRAVTVSEIVKALLPKEISLLETKYSESIKKLLHKIVTLLCKRGKIEILGKSGNRKYYGVTGALDKENPGIPNLKSNRQRALELVKKAVLFYERALQMGQIVEFAHTQDEYQDFSPKSICHSILSLKQTGEITLAASIRGSSKGFGLYLPSDFDINNFLPKEPSTWLEFVLDTFNKTWEDHLSEAKEKNKKPFPITTGEIRAKIIESGKFPEKLKQPMTVVNSMRQLGLSDSPSVRKIKRPNQKAVLWVPPEIPDNEVDLGDVYAHDTERLEEAVKRAVLRLGRPVELSEIKKETETDISLKPASPSAYHSLLADVTKKRIGTGKSKLQPRVNWRVHRVGKFQGHTFYHSTNSPEAKAYIELKSLKEKWDGLETEKEINSIENFLLPTVAFGRMLLLAQETEFIFNRNRKLKKLEKILGITEKEFKEFVINIAQFRKRINEWLENKYSQFPLLPKIVNNKIEGLTAHELLDLLNPFYHRLQSIKPQNSLQSLIGNSIRRFPNPEFERINLKDPRLAAEYLYDKTDALIYIAKTWGGPESRLQANLASNELGLLRDAAFVLSDLDNDNFNVRLSAIACLAFLQSEKSNEKLRNIAINDIDAGIKQSALWAYGLMGGKNVINFIEERSLQDKDSRVKNFAAKLIGNYSGKWFDF